ncbi:putative MFS monocarboxylate transporter [Xylogone sp. PMI_703]|nr:putative MFS monocarboxylate transporter [Xylogone sp. PMI_703]
MTTQSHEGLEISKAHTGAVEKQASENSPIESSSSLPEYEDNIVTEGFQAWLQVLGSFCFYFNSWRVGNVEGFMLLFIGVLSGTLHDRGYFRHLVTFGSFLTVFSLMMMSLTKPYWQIFLAHGVSLGLGTAVLYLPSLSVVATYFNKNRGLAIGLSIASGQLGGVVYPIVFRQLEPQLGFGWTIRVIGFIALGLLVISNTVMRPRLSPKGKCSPILDSTAFREPHYILFTAGLFLTLIGLYLPWYFGPTYGTVVLGMNVDQSFYLTAIVSGVSIAGCILASVAADMLGPINVMIHSIVPGFQAFTAFYGFFTGALITIPNQVLAYLSPSPQQIGTRIGMCYSIAAFGLLIGSPSGSALLDIPAGKFLRLQIYGVMLFGGALLFLLAALDFQRQKRHS